MMSLPLKGFGMSIILSCLWMRAKIIADMICD